MAQLCLWTKIRTKQGLVLVRRLFNVCVRIFCASKGKFLLVYTSTKIKMSFIWRDNFFFAKISIFCKSIAGPLPSVVKTDSQPYLFGERIKLIMCEIRHELSVIIHEISTSWTKTLDGASFTSSSLLLTFYKIDTNYFIHDPPLPFLSKFIFCSKEIFSTKYIW